MIIDCITLMQDNSAFITGELESIRCVVGSMKKLTCVELSATVVRFLYCPSLCLSVSRNSTKQTRRYILFVFKLSLH